MDDIYDPQGRSGLDLNEIVSLIAHSHDVLWPTVVTCGPPEFHEALSDDAREQAQGDESHDGGEDERQSLQMVVFLELESGATAETGGVLELLFDSQEPVVLGDPIRAAERARPMPYRGRATGALGHPPARHFPFDLLGDGRWRSAG